MKINEFLKQNNDFYEKCMVFLRFSLVFHCFSTHNQYTSEAKPLLLSNPLIFFFASGSLSWGSIGSPCPPLYQVEVCFHATLSLSKALDRPHELVLVSIQNYRDST